MSVVEGFRRHGGRTALLAFNGDASRTIAYQDLVCQIDETARGLQALHRIGRGDFVAIWAPNSAEWIVAYFAVIRAGASVIPIDHQSTATVAAAILAHAKPRLMFTTGAHRAGLREEGGTLPTLALFDCDEGESEHWRNLARGNGNADRESGGATNEPAAVANPRPDDIAALLYTSGTTGTPKAVPLTHGNLSANLQALRQQRLIAPDDRMLLPLPLHHTYPLTVGLLTAFDTGAAVILPSGISGPEILRAAAAGQATAMLAVPRLCAGLWDGVIAGVRARGPRMTRRFFALLRLSIAVRRLTGLRAGRWLFRAVHARVGPKLTLIGCGGAKLPADLAWNLEGLGWTVLTGYGLTETSPVVTFNSHRRSRIGTEGRPLPGVSVRIATAGKDSNGEILVRGPNVFRGYWRNPEATAAAFTPDGWFKTGDLGRHDSAGYLHVEGRSKELIVLADGKKVYPEETERVYAAVTLLREVALLEQNGRLVALVVPNEDAMREQGTVRQATALRAELEDVAARLAPYQRLTGFRISREPLPRTQLGKLKRHLLPDLYRAAAEQSRAAGPAELNDADRELLAGRRAQAVWAWLLERYAPQRLTLDTSPQLDLGIDSLEWVGLTIEVERRLGITLRGEAVSRILTLRDLLREVQLAPAGVAAADGPAFHKPNAPLRALGAVLFALCRVTMKIAYRAHASGVDRLPDGPCVIAPSHASYLDPLALAAALPWKRLRRTYWAGWVGVMHTNWLTRFVSRAMQVFPVDQDRDVAAAIRAAQALLDEGYSVVWFPEGRRSPTGALGDFQAGVGLLLGDSGVPAVPTAIFGAFAAWPKHARYPRRGRVAVTFGEPMRFVPEEASAIPDKLREAVGSMLDRGEERTAGIPPGSAPFGDGRETL